MDSACMTHEVMFCRWDAPPSAHVYDAKKRMHLLGQLVIFSALLLAFLHDGLAAKEKSCNRNQCKLPSVRRPKNLLEWTIDDSPASCADNGKSVRLVPAVRNAITSQEITFRCENGKMIHVPSAPRSVHPRVIIDIHSEEDANKDLILQRCTVRGVNARPTWFFLDVAKRTWRQIASYKKRNRNTTYVVEEDNNDSLLYVPIMSNNVYGTYKCAVENVERNITVEAPRCDTARLRAVLLRRNGGTPRGASARTSSGTTLTIDCFHGVPDVDVKCDVGKWVSVRDASENISDICWKCPTLDSLLPPSKHVSVKQRQQRGRNKEDQVDSQYEISCQKRYLNSKTSQNNKFNVACFDKNGDRPPSYYKIDSSSSSSSSFSADEIECKPTEKLVKQACGPCGTPRGHEEPLYMIAAKGEKKPDFVNVPFRKATCKIDVACSDNRQQETFYCGSYSSSTTEFKWFNRERQTYDQVC